MRVLNTSHPSIVNMIAWIESQGIDVEFDAIRAHFGWTREVAPDHWIRLVLDSQGFPVVN